MSESQDETWTAIQLWRMSDGGYASFESTRMTREMAVQLAESGKNNLLTQDYPAPMIVACSYGQASEYAMSGPSYSELRGRRSSALLHQPRDQKSDG